MESRTLCVILLLAVFCLWYTEASPLEDKYDQKYEVEDYRGGSEDTKAAINDNAARVASHSAKSHVNKALVVEAAARLNAQIAKDRNYYAREYTKLAEESKKRARQYGQLADMEAGRIGQHEHMQQEWNSKARESEAQCKATEAKAQEEYTKARDERQKSLVSNAEAAMHDAQATVDTMKSERAYEIGKELMRKAENARNDASNHYQRAKENRERANSETVKSHQQAQDAQRHNAASKAYQQDGLRTRMASRINIMKYIQSSLLAERAANQARIEQLKSEWYEKAANEYSRMSEENAAISKLAGSEEHYFAQRAKRNEGKAYELSQSKRMMGSEAAAAGELLAMSQAKDDETEDEKHFDFPIYESDDPTKLSPSPDEKDLTYGSGEGL
uniref:Mantis fibroin 1 n=1 Tax=Tenodera australasiae TaxID=267140 RepID=I3PM90_9NEOP|nr:mantis fibroin 1 [Tenodera australasiae]